MPLSIQSASSQAAVRSRLWIGGLAFLFLNLLVSGGCGGARIGPGIKGSGVLKTEARPAAAFTRIDVGSVVRLEWKPAKEPSLEVSAEDNLLPLLVTEVAGNTLKIHFKESVNPTKDVVVKVAGPALDGFSGSGASQSTLDGARSDDFTLELSGASQCTIVGQAKSLKVDCSGASQLKGEKLEADAATVDTSGSATATIHATGLKAVDASGASKVTIAKVNSDEVKVVLSGSSQCTLSGQVKKLTIDAAAASAVHAAELKAQMVHVDLGGSARAEVTAEKSLAGSAAGASRVRYGGNPAAQTVKTSGAATVEQK